MFLAARRLDSLANNLALYIGRLSVHWDHDRSFDVLEGGGLRFHDERPRRVISVWWLLRWNVRVPLWRDRRYCEHGVLVALGCRDCEARKEAPCP